MFKINPEWKKYNDFLNEGGEGYNPHKKWISSDEMLATNSSAQKESTQCAASDRLLKDQRGNSIRESVLRNNLQKDLARLEKVTDPFGRKIIEDSIAHAKQQLSQ